MNTEWNHPFRANYMDLMQPKRGVYFNIKVELKEKELPLISQRIYERKYPEKFKKPVITPQPDSTPQLLSDTTENTTI